MTNSPSPPEELPGRQVDIGDTRLHIVERGAGYPLIVLHGGPGLDHHMFGDYLDLLGDAFRLILVDQRGQGRSDPAPLETLTLKMMARDIVELARALNLDRYAVLGHSYGALVTLQNAVDYPVAAAQSIISSGLPSARYLEQVWENLAAFEPEMLRAQVTQSWEKEKSVQSDDEVAALIQEQMPFHFADPTDPRLAGYAARTAGACFSARVLNHFANLEYGGIEVEDRLSRVSQPVLVLAGRHDRTCSVQASEAIARGIPGAELVVFENSAHMTFVEENDLYLAAVRDFLNRTR